MSNRRRILVVEDEPVINQTVSDRLLAEGYQVVRAWDGPGAVAACAEHRPDLVLLDVMLPGYDGHEVCRRIQADRPVPVLMLTARDDEADVLVGLGVGADDYLTKPFRMRELVARVAALLRRVERADSLVARQPRQYGDVRIDEGARRVWRADTEVHLTPTEFDLLAALAAEPGTVVSRERLMAEVWGWPGGTGNRTVDSHVKALRAKIGADRVRTVHGVGYALEPGDGRMTTPRPPLASVGSLKVKLGLLVVVSVVVTALVAGAGRTAGVPGWLSIPVTILLALAITQLLAVGMVAPLREMTTAAQRMARGDYAVRVTDTARDEVGDLGRAFNRMARDLASVDRQRRDLVANVSHELRTPLAALRAVLENLVDGVGPRDPRSLEPALAQAERLSELVDDLLDLARVDAGGSPLTPRPVPVRPLLDDAVAEAGMSERGVSYDLRVDPPDLRVDADPARIRQLVANLLDNASRHSPAGATVAVRVAVQGDRWLLEVQDRGAGIAPADRERAFEPFGTLGDTESGGGTGLGLAIARWVTDLHGGTIRFVDPEPGTTGARVAVDLPLHPPLRPGPPPPPGRPPGRPSGPTVVPEEDAVPTTANEPTAAAPTPDAVPVAARPLLDDLFGGFWPDRTPARLTLLGGAFATGVLGAVVIPFHDAGLGLTLLLLAAGAVVLAAAGRRRGRFTYGCAALCALLAVVPTVRDADWMIALSVLAGAMVCVVGVTGARTLPGMLVAALSWPLAGLRGLPWLGRTITVLTGIGDGAALLRTALWSLAGLVVFGLLFASADALFAEWASSLLPDLTLDTFVLRVFVTVAVGGVVLAAAYLALNPPRVDRRETAASPVARRFEWLAPVLVVNGVFAVFLAAQATVIFGGHDYLRRTTGLTYAEYVHQGFGQLTVATALTLLVVAVAARKAPRTTPADRTWLRASLGLLCVQTLVVVASALHRMHLYQEAYGFTRLRLVVDVFEGWLGLLVLAVLAGGVALHARWLPRFALITGAAAMLGLAVINPDAWIAEHNLDRYAETGRLDWEYLAGLSDDAVPVLTRLPADLEACVLSGRTAATGDWLEWNLGRSRAADRLPADEPEVAVGCPTSW